MIPPPYITDYLTKSFGKKGKFSSNGREFMMPSPFIDNDWKMHFSINTETGLWQDFKTGQAGNFIHFVALIENIPYQKALAKLLFYEFEHGSYDPPPTNEVETPLDMPENLIPININSHSSPDKYIQKAWVFLYERNLFNTEEETEEPYYICTKGKYENRLIIPFKYDEEMFYFQARALNWENPKYLNPTGTYIKPSNILYPFDDSEDYVIVCEGPLDAIALQLQGVNSTATMGCSISEAQAEILKEFQGKIILGYDNDEAGKRGLEKFESLRKSKMMDEFYTCPPPSKYKDWGEAHAQKENLGAWIKKNTHKYNYEYIVSSTLSLL